MYSAVLFDFDGTLVDSQRGILHCLRAVLPKYGVVKTDAELLADIGPPFQVVWPSYGVAPGDFDACLADYRTLYRSGPWHDLDIYEGVPELLHSLHDAGVRLAVATSKLETVAVELVSHLGWADHFETVVGGDPAHDRMHKAEIIAEALTRLDTSDAAMVGDKGVDIVGATACGIPAIGALWGFGTQHELTDAGATALAQSPTQLPAILTSLQSTATSN